MILKPHSPALAKYIPRILQKVDFEPSCGCWLWTGGQGNGGYGLMRYEGRLVVAHRAVYMVLRGPIPPRLYLLHRCDTPQCVNPDHLTPGTQKENVADAKRKGRFLGDLTPDQVRHIRRREKSITEYAAEYGMTPAAIGNIMHRRRYAEIE